MDFATYFALLKGVLIPAYTPPRAPAGNDHLHCDRMATYWGPRIRAFLAFDTAEYLTACWLHNLDVTQTGKRPFEEIEPELWGLLGDSPFGREARGRIVDAVRQHPKFKDDPADSALLTALRIADKVDKLDDATMGIIGACAMRGTQVLAYDPKQPFHYGSTDDGKLKSVYNDFMRQLEWYGMLPSDEARSLVADDSMRFYVQFLRRYGAFVARHTGLKDECDDDLQKALGPYYDRFAR
jgi:hypothetical protein